MAGISLASRLTSWDRGPSKTAFAAADWLIHSDAITRCQIDALPTVDNRLNAEEFQTMMCATIGGIVPMFAGKIGKPIRVIKAGSGGQIIRTDGALKLPLDARATNLLAADVGDHDGSFSGRHDGLRDLIYDEVVRAGGTARKEVELGTEHGLAETHVLTIRAHSNKARADHIDCLLFGVLLLQHCNSQISEA